jgi:hypothetical protein
MIGSADDDLLAVEAGDDAQRPVGGRVLGTDVQRHAVGLELDVDAALRLPGRRCRTSWLRSLMAAIRPPRRRR